MVSAVADRGYGETRVVDVVARAGVSRATFYQLFDDLEDCFLATLDYVAGRLLDTTTAGFNEDPDADWPDRVRNGVAAFLNLLAEWPEGARFAITEVLAAGREALRRRDAVTRRFAELVDTGRQDSQIDPPGVTSVAVVGGVQELLMSELVRGDVAHLRRHLPEIVYLITEPFLGSEAAAAERDRARRSLVRAG